VIDHALAYAARGWAVIPLERRGKTPLNPNGSKGASRSPLQITEWWERWPNANVGIATGKGSGLLVVDLDGAEGVLGWMALVASHGTPWYTLSFRTGGGGAHLLYADTTGLPNSASRLADKVDTRGEGGYIVAPPSVHPNGNHYRLMTDLPIADVPAWVRRTLRPPAQPPRIPAHEMFPRRGAPAPVRTERDWLAEHEQRITAAANGQRNETLNRAAFLCGRDVARGTLVESEVVSVLTRAARAAGLTARETERTIHSGLVAGMANSSHAPAPAYWPRRGH